MWLNDDPLFRHGVAVSVGYFAFDAVLCIAASQLRETSTFAHHFFAGGALLLGLLTRVGTPYHSLFMINELSTPFVNAHYMLHKSGRSGSVTYVLNGVFMWLTFLVFRMVANSFLMVCRGGRGRGRGRGLLVFSTFYISFPADRCPCSTH